MIKNLRNIFDTFKWRKFIPFWRKGGSSIVQYMNEHKMPFRDINNVFETYGSDFYEIIKKLSIDRMMENDFNKLNDVQKGTLGATIFLEFMKELKREVDELDSQ